MLKKWIQQSNKSILILGADNGHIIINGDFQDAADAYIASLQTERQGPRAPDALIRLGASFAALGQSGQACQVLATFPAEFPRASEDARRKAQREVARIGCR